MVQGSRSLRKGELLAILGEIFRNRETGTLVLQQGAVSKFLYAQEGNLIFAASNAPEDKFTQILIDKGKLTNDQLAMAQEKKENRTIGRTLVELGFLGSEDLLDALVNQMRKIADSVANWDTGVAAFKPGILPPNLAKLPISTPRFILDTALVVEDREWAADGLGKLEDVLDMAEPDRDMARTLTLSPEETRVLENIDGKKNAREICLGSDVNLFTGVRFLIGLHELGWVALEPTLVPAPPPAQTPASPLPPPKATKEAVDLSFLDKVTPAPVPPPAPGSAEKEPIPPPPFEVKEVPTLPPKPPFLFEGEEPATAFTPVNLAAPPPPPAPPEVKPKPEPRAERPPIEMASPDLLSPLDDEEEEAQQPEPPSDRPQVPLPSFLQGGEEEEEEEPPRRFSWGLIAVLASVLVVLGGVVAFTAWFLFLRQSPFVPVQTQTGPKKPIHAANSTIPSKPGVPKPPANAAANAPVVTPPANTVAPPPSNTVVPPPSNTVAPPSNTAKPPVTTPANTAPPKVPANGVPPPPPKKPETPPAKPETPAVGGDARALLEKGQFAEAASVYQAEMQKKRGGFTINIEIACQPETVSKGFAAAGSSTDFMILPYNLKGRSCYRVIWGYYPDKASADAAFQSLPSFFKQGASPQVAPWR